ncbi:MAG TPA: hypothetical protein ACHBZ9_13695 [Arsenophonus nasoniae]|uniref:hypothetical protein n=1 Tax=Arsenophonus nasoniae TaxID=638 RepID=UPI00387A4E8C
MDKPKGHKRGLLEPYEKEMREMRERGFSFQQISDWLLTKNIIVSKGTVRLFLK